MNVSAMGVVLRDDAFSVRLLAVRVIVWETGGQELLICPGKTCLEVFRRPKRAYGRVTEEGRAMVARVLTNRTPAKLAPFGFDSRLRCQESNHLSSAGSIGGIPSLGKFIALMPLDIV